MKKPFPAQTPRENFIFHKNKKMEMSRPPSALCDNLQPAKQQTSMDPRPVLRSSLGNNLSSAGSALSRNSKNSE